jgi:hypothetical protein
VICFRRIRLTAIDASYRYSRTAKRAGIVTLQLTPVANLGYGATQIEWSSRKEQIAKQKSAYNDLPGRFEVIGVTERSICWATAVPLCRRIKSVQAHYTFRLHGSGT